MSLIMTAAMCVAVNNYHEARSASFKEQLLVASTVYNRASAKNTNPCEEVFRPKQYSWTNNKYRFRKSFPTYTAMLKYYHIDDMTSFSTSINSASLAKDFRNTDVTHYYDNTIKTTKWASSMQLVSRTKNFNFYKG